MNASSTSPLRLLTLTTLFPNVRQPRHGIFIANRLRRICDTGQVEAKVIAAVPRFPGAYRHLVDVPASESVCGFDVSHPRYVNVPGIGMRLQPRLLARALMNEIRRNPGEARSFNVVDSHYLYPDGIAAMFVADALQLPLVLSARGSDVNLIANGSFARRRIGEAIDRSQAVIAVSQALADRMRALGIAGDRVEVLRNGVDLNLFTPAPRADARRRFAIDEKGKWILAVGNLVPEKGFDLLVRVVGDMPHVRLLVIGEGPMSARLRKLAQEAAPHRVEFRSNVSQPELRFAYAAADVLALPSLREGWPNVLLEALACGTPVVAANVGGVAEIVGGSGAPGRLLAGRSSVEWQGAIDAMLDASLTPESVRAYAMRFGWDDVVSRQAAVYHDVARRWRQAPWQRTTRAGALGVERS
ncbi:MAG TPA: glycosyltransferase [Casimicrobiaceae bacterium]|nr:glycosyltransferase [Casimicrobiaceae bacterium]